MNEILLCTHNPLLTKSFYGMLRDEGYSIDVVDQPSSAIRQAMDRSYTSIIIDSEAFGLSAAEATAVLRSILPDVLLFVIGDHPSPEGALHVSAPLDLEEFKEVLHTIRRFANILQN